MKLGVTHGTILCLACFADCRGGGILLPLTLDWIIGMYFFPPSDWEGGRRWFNF